MFALEKLSYEARPKWAGMRSEFEAHNECVEKFFGETPSWQRFSLGNDDIGFFRNYFENAPVMKIMANMDSIDFFAINFAADEYKTLNQNLIFRDFRGTESMAQILLAKIRDSVGEFMKSEYRVVNIRGWETSSSSSAFGPSTWHFDGFPDGHIKIMIYLDGLGGPAGTIEIDGVGALEGPPGSCLIFQNSGVLHRAVRPEAVSRRPVLEVTLQRLLREPASDAPMIGSPNAQHLVTPWRAYGI